MTKLSRTSRYKDLRDQLDEETTKAQTTPEQPIKLSRSSSAAGSSRNPGSSSASAIAQLKAGNQSGVLDELLGEVKQYNISQGQRVIDDTQFNILESLNENDDPSIKRAMHIEPMEANANPGGTTMNIDRINISSFPASNPAPKSQAQFLGGNNITVDEYANTDNLQVFDIGAEDFDRTIRQSTPKPVKKQKTKRKDRKNQPIQSSTQSIAMKNEDDEEEDTKSGSIGWLNIFLGILIVLLLISIGFTIYLIIQAGIL